MISSHIEELLQQLKHTSAWSIESNESDELVNVHEITSRTGTYYEKLRYLLDNKEEHLIRRSAIERILRRRILIEQSRDVGPLLLRELVSGGYLQNNSVPERVARDVQRIAGKYLIVRDVLRDKGQLNGDLSRLLLSLTANEIEQYLFPSHLDELTTTALYKTVRGSVQTSYSVTPEELDEQIYIACRRALLRNDDSAITYALWRRAVPEWDSLATDAQVAAVGEHFYTKISVIRERLKHPLGWQLVAKLRNYAIYFSLIREVVSQYGVEAQSILADDTERERIIREYLTERYGEQTNKARRSGIRSTLYVLLTKTVLAIGVELPYEIIFLGSIAYPALITNIVFHPLLLFLMTRTIRQPGEENTKHILRGISHVVTGAQLQPLTIRRKGVRTLLDAVFLVLYAGLFVTTFGIILWILQELHFNVLSIVLFIFFLTLVTYLGLRIRFNARRWQVDTGSENTLTLIWNLFTLPLVRIGRWLNRRFSSVNVFVFFLDFIIETPFKLLLQVMDAFMAFLREKREETYNM